MIVIFEMDVRKYSGKRFNWRPGWFSARWNEGKMWRLAWGFWSLSSYPSPGLKDLFDHVRDGLTEWRMK
jgi:hypothetical protein